MKKILCLIIGLTVCLASTACAELYVIVNPVTNEIYSVSEKNDTVMPVGMELQTLPGDFSTYEFAENPTNCKLIEGRFVVDTKKINDAYQAELTKKEIDEEEALIEKKMKDIAIAELKKEGKALKHNE